MIKVYLVFIPLLLSVSVSATAQDRAKSAPYYILNEWPGAYQSGYEVQEEITLDLYESPTNLANIGFCTLKKGRSFHPFSNQNKNDKFVVISGVKVYQAKQDFIDDLSNEHKKGDLILQVAELSEGVCINQKDGEIYEDTCPSLYETWKLVFASPLQDHRLIQTTCDDGNKGWLKESELQAYIREGDPNSLVRPLTESELYDRGWMIN